MKIDKAAVKNPQSFTIVYMEQQFVLPLSMINIETIQKNEEILNNCIKTQLKKFIVNQSNNLIQYDLNLLFISKKHFTLRNNEN